MFNIGGSEMILLAVLALLVFGPEGLPDIMKTVARTIKAFKTAANDFQSEVNTALILENQKNQVEQRRRKRVLPQGETVAEDGAVLPESGDDPTDDSDSKAEVEDREPAPQVLADEKPAITPETDTPEMETAESTNGVSAITAESTPAPALLSGDAAYDGQSEDDEDGPGRPMCRSARAEEAQPKEQSEPPAADLETVS